MIDTTTITTAERYILLGLVVFALLYIIGTAPFIMGRTA
jgi:hypothetical protein